MATKDAKVKLYDVVDGNKKLLNIYTDKEVAEAFAGKEKGRKVVPSPADRTREDVTEAIRERKAARLKELEGSAPGIYKP